MKAIFKVILWIIILKGELMLFCKKRDINRQVNLKQELVEDVIYTNKILKIICSIEAVTIVGLCVAFIITKF